MSNKDSAKKLRNLIVKIQKTELYRNEHCGTNDTHDKVQELLDQLTSELALLKSLAVKFATSHSEHECLNEIDDYAGNKDFDSSKNLIRCLTNCASNGLKYYAPFLNNLTNLLNRWADELEKIKPRKRGQSELDLLVEQKLRKNPNLNSTMIGTQLEVTSSAVRQTNSWKNRLKKKK